MTKRELIEALKDVADNAEIIIGAQDHPETTGCYTDQIFYDAPYEDNEQGRVIITNRFMDKVSSEFNLIYEK